MVSKLLEIEKLESGNLEVSISSIEVNEIIAQSVESVAQFADAHKVQLETKKTDLKVKADSLYIGNVLTNLISNAIKFSSENSKVVIETKDLGETAEISVSDKGPGVPLRMQSQIFEKIPPGQIHHETEPKALDWGWPSANQLWNCTAELSGWKAKKKAKIPAAASGSACQRHEGNWNLQGRRHTLPYGF